jgi:hypothetical protein
MDRNQATEEFARVLFQVGIQERSVGFYEMFQYPAAPQKDKWTQIKEWYESQTEEQQHLFAFLIREAMVFAVFGLAAYLDSASGYHFVGERPVDFAIAMQVYNNLDDAMEGNVEERIEFCPNPDGEYIHDILLNLVDQWEDSPDDNHTLDDRQT